ncbi:MAG: hypothetical protein V4539_05895 [Bacteroidota bacterium]
MSSVKNAQPLYKLSETEMNDPTLVIDELFDFADLQDVRELLWGWLKTTVTGTFHKDLSASERSAILSLYEKMEKLVEAAHMIHENPERVSRKGAKMQRRKGR